MFFEIGDQRRAEMAIGLLAAIDRHVAAEHIERLLTDTKGAPVAGRADHARTGEIIDHLIERLLHFAMRHDLVADHAAFRTVAIESAANHDQLPRNAGADET